MALTINDKQTEKLLADLAAATGETLEEALRRALAEQLEHTPKKKQTKRRPSEVLSEAAEELSKLPVLDDRDPNELLGYNEHGTWD